MYHRIIIAGHLGRDPEMRYTPNGTPVTTFTMASTRRWTDQNGEQQEETIWFRVSTFGRLAETCNQYLQKGRAVLVEGRLQPGDNGGPRLWTGQDGVVRANFDVVATTVRFLGRGGGADSEAEEEAAETSVEEDIPF